MVEKAPAVDAAAARISLRDDGLWMKRFGSSTAGLLLKGDQRSTSETTVHMVYTCLCWQTRPDSAVR